MRHVMNLMPPGTEPSRFAAVVVPGLRESCMWVIDDEPTIRKNGLLYLSQVRDASEGMGRLDQVLARRLVEYAGHSRPDSSLAYLTTFALTETLHGRGAIIEIGGMGLSITPIMSPDFQGAVAQFDAMGLDTGEPSGTP